MKQIKLSVVIIFSACLLFSCTGNDSSAGKKNSDAKTSGSDSKTASSDANLAGTNGSFIYTVNGTSVNAANNGSGSKSLFINEVSNDAANGMLKIEITPGSNVFKFNIVNSGTTTITNYNPSLAGFGDKKTKGASYMDGSVGKNLYAVSVTVTITSINDSRVKGTFSGTFKVDKHDSGGATASITDGSFNLPFVKN